MEDAPLRGDDHSAELVGLADPYGLRIGFMIPIFRQPPRNSLLVQVIDRAGSITGFEPCDLPDVEMAEIPPRLLSPDAPELWAFQFEDTVIVGNDESARQTLTGLLDDRLAELPLLAMEVAEFLRLPDQRDKFARLAFDRMGEVSSRAAKAWRDLSVLTPDVRRRLLRKLGQDAKWPRRILATVETESAVAIHGLRDWPSSEITEILRNAVTGATKNMPRLYDGGTQKSVVYATPRSENGDQVKVRLVVDRTIDVEQLTWKLRRTGTFNMELVGWDGEEAFKDLAYPTIALLNGLSEERLREIEHKAESRPVPVLAYGRPVDERSLDLNALKDYSGLIIQVEGSHSSKTGEPIGRNGIEVGVEAVLQIAAGRMERPVQCSVLVAASISRKLGDPYGLVELYDEAYYLGFAPWDALHLGPAEPRTLSAREQAVADALFPDLVSLRSGGWSPPGDEWQAIYALLLVPRSRSADEDLRYRRDVVRLFEIVGWRVSDIAPDWRAFRITGKASTLAVKIEPPLSMDELSASAPPRNFKIGRIETIRIAPRASASDVVRHLGYVRELVAKLSDILLLDPSKSATWGIAALQLRRMYAPRPEYWRTHYVRALVREAIALGNYHAELDQRILDAVAAVGTGKLYHLMIERASIHDDLLRARVVFLTNKSGDQKTWTPESKFILRVSSEGPSIGPFGRDKAKSADPAQRG